MNDVDIAIGFFIAGLLIFLKGWRSYINIRKDWLK